MFKNGIHICFKKFTKDPNRQERDKTSHETYMKRPEEERLKHKQLPTSSPTGNPTSSTFFPTNNSTSFTFFSTTISSNTYVYSVGIVVVLAIGACVFFAYNTSQATNKKQADEKQDQPPKRPRML